MHTLGYSASTDQLLAAAKVLESNPLYVLSTAGQELFHTNMLFWLARTYPVEAQPLFEKFGLDRLTDPDDSDQPVPSVWRERHDIDLVVDVGTGKSKLLLENNVLSLPRREQLSGYTSRAKEFFDGKGEVHFRLLTLMHTQTQIQGPWKVVGYSNLIQAMGQVSAGIRVRNAFHADLTEQYQSLVQELVTVCDSALPENLSEPWTLPRVARAELREMRVLPLVEKLRANYLAEKVGAATGEDVDAFLTRTLGAVQWYDPMPIAGTKHHKGIQLQGDQFRLVVTTGDDAKLSGSRSGRRERRHAYVRDHYADDFRFPPMSFTGAASVLGADKSRKEWPGYDPDFVYQYRPVASDATWEQVLALFSAGISHAKNWQPPQS